MTTDPSALEVPAIRVMRLSKSYKMYETPRDLLVEALTGRKRHRDKAVLENLDFSIARGEVVGVVGQNGAGKSTLLKMIAGTLTPTTGTIEVDGRIAAILELGTGFNPNYTGRENVILSGMLRGMTEEQVRGKLESIIRFSGLESVIDEPFHTYSSGMQARLAFATAVSVDADVIIIDEALAAGDVRFASRSLRRIREISQSGVTCLFVSHVTYQIMQLCSRVIWIDKGRVRMDGPAIDVVRAYEYEMHNLIARDRGDPLESSEGSAPVQTTAEEAAGTAAPLEPGESAPAVEAFEAAAAVPLAVPELNVEPQADSQIAALEPQVQTPEDQVLDPGDGAPAATDAPQTPAPTMTVAAPETDKRSHYSTGAYRITRIRFLDGSGRETMIFRFGEVFRLQVAYERLLQDDAEISCGLAVAFNRASDFEAVMYFNTSYPHSDQEIVDYETRPFRLYKGRQGLIEARIEPLQIKAGEYHVSLGILPNTSTHHEFFEYLHCHFQVVVLPNGFDEPSVFYPMVTWSNGPDAR